MVNTTDPSEEHYNPTIRLCEVERPSSGSSGFNLSRTKWDPYPWVTGVDPGSPAEQAGLHPGDCILEVNGEDVLGERINEVGSKVKSKEDRVQLLLWNAGADPQCSPEVSDISDVRSPIGLFVFLKGAHAHFSKFYRRNRKKAV